jgi:hypothetical protein
MVALSHIFVAIAISFSANVFAEAPTAYGK